MKTITKKAGIIFLALVTTLAFTFVPIGISSPGGSKAGVDVAHAGEGMESIKPYVKGLNSDNSTIDPEETISISLDDLDTNIRSGMKSAYLNKTIDIKWVAEDKDEPFKNSKALSTYYKDGKICADVSLKDGGKNIRLYIDSKDTGAFPNMNSEIVAQIYGTAHDIDGPSLSTSYYRTASMLKANYTFYTDAKTITYNYKEHYHSAYNVIVKLFRNGKEIRKVTTSNSSIDFNNVPLSYGKTDSFKVQLFLNISGVEVKGNAITFSDTSPKLGKNTVLATKLSKKKASLRWGGTQGATGYRVYMGSKLIKTTGAGTKKLIVTKKGAGNAKFKVIPICKIGKTTVASGSNVAKPKANKFTTGNTPNPGEWRVTAVFRVKSISLKGKTYTVTGWGVNKSHYTKLKKFKKIKITVYCDGKKVLSKTVKNKCKNLKPQRSKKLKFKLKGKKGADLANGYVTYSVSVSCDPATLTPY